MKFKGVKIDVEKAKTFGKWLDKVQRQLRTASETIDESGTRRRAMERKLREVMTLPAAEAANILTLPTTTEDTEPEGWNVDHTADHEDDTSD